eukprot:GILJ01014212.1.p1 GENE.GILJ01014212.1~~GILJ01014212.1.p1  ORF type:complete len:941 (-),score=142.41 GILJ01014212.1:103-2817(-)
MMPSALSLQKSTTEGVGAKASATTAKAPLYRRYVDTFHNSPPPVHNKTDSVSAPAVSVFRPVDSEKLVAFQPVGSAGLHANQHVDVYESLRVGGPERRASIVSTNDRRRWSVDTNSNLSFTAFREQMESMRGERQRYLSMLPANQSLAEEEVWNGRLDASMSIHDSLVSLPEEQPDAMDGSRILNGRMESSRDIAWKNPLMTSQLASPACASPSLKYRGHPVEKLTDQSAACIDIQRVFRGARVRLALRRALAATSTSNDAAVRSAMEPFHTPLRVSVNQSHLHKSGRDIMSHLVRMDELSAQKKKSVSKLGSSRSLAYAENTQNMSHGKVSFIEDRVSLEESRLVWVVLAEKFAGDYEKLLSASKSVYESIVSSSGSGAPQQGSHLQALDIVRFGNELSSSAENLRSIREAVATIRTAVDENRHLFSSFSPAFIIRTQMDVMNEKLGKDHAQQTRSEQLEMEKRSLMDQLDRAQSLQSKLLEQLAEEKQLRLSAESNVLRLQESYDAMAKMHTQNSQAEKDRLYTELNQYSTRLHHEEECRIRLEERLTSIQTEVKELHRWKDGTKISPPKGQRTPLALPGPHSQQQQLQKVQHTVPASYTAPGIRHSPLQKSFDLALREMTDIVSSSDMLFSSPKSANHSLQKRIVALQKTLSAFQSNLGDSLAHVVSSYATAGAVPKPAAAATRYSLSGSKASDSKNTLSVVPESEMLQSGTNSPASSSPRYSQEMHLRQSLRAIGADKENMGARDESFMSKASEYGNQFAHLALSGLSLQTPVRLETPAKADSSHCPLASKRESSGATTYDDPVSSLANHPYLKDTKMARPFDNGSVAEVPSVHMSRTNYPPVKEFPASGDVVKDLRRTSELFKRDSAVLSDAAQFKLKLPRPALRDLRNISSSRDSTYL